MILRLSNCVCVNEANPFDAAPERSRTSIEVSWTFGYGYTVTIISS
ncbi:hypothetical protein MITSMUL_03661 [Mitsuokella multacida DSM 20544]|uniref:Uncharacterized protein n=1 Tax=Mitsuokella multacida DSM 20544 TaxID=500635 RepID=C9KKG2_9FIRM|nr:hypothetical protein MITSMUL_03661 [Mitsuokella multacida DSM 20544]